MDKYLLIFFFSTMFNFFQNSQAQNLVPNPSFEVYDSCPDDVGEIDSAIGWSNFGNGSYAGASSPDYFNSCADASVFPDSLVSVPHNQGGYQYAATGNAYCGIICYAVTFPDYREIIGCQLINPLEIGAIYHISFKINCSFGGYMGNYLASNGLGVKLTNIPFTNNNPIPIDNNPLFYSSTIFTDTLNWTTIEYDIVADSAYQYIAIGNFFDALHTDTIHLGSFIFRSYYYIDDVSLIKETENGVNTLYQNGLSVFPNPVNDVLYVRKEGCSVHLITLINKMGQIFFQQAENFSNSNNISIDVKKFPAGIYFIQLNDEKKVQQHLLLIQH
ncbi:MAG: T9SS type A sorting domain-containing protein [Chitinophagales bacterium]